MVGSLAGGPLAAAQECKAASGGGSIITRSRDGGRGQVVPQLVDGGVEDEVGGGGGDDPGAGGQLALQLIGAPAGVAGEDAVAGRLALFRLRHALQAVG